MRIRFRTGDRCCHCGTQWSSRWFAPQRGALAGLALCADCNCACGRRAVDHRSCGGARQYTASPGQPPPAAGPVQGRLFG
jgi:hypothetical protein